MNNLKRLRVPILDKGFIEVIDTLGSDLTVANAARVSYGKRKKVYDQRDRKLVGWLAANKHFSPFRHVQVQFHVKAPEFVMRQWYKHVVGTETTSTYSTKDTPWNEISGRYIEVTDYYRPDVFRRQSTDNKQCSEGRSDDQKACARLMDESLTNAIESYKKLLELGVAKEQARTILPLSQYTQVYWTTSFQAIANFIELRDERTSQYEIQQYAQVIKDMMNEMYPETMGAWMENYGKSS